MKGYKVFDSDWKCNGFRYKVGKTFKHIGEIEIDGAGFHFCEKLIDCFNYYDFNRANKVAEIEASGNIKTDGEKSVTDEIKIVREMNWLEVLEMVNTGKNCTGFQNSGSFNSGNNNSGNYNSGHHNSGNCNLGDFNSGNLNCGGFNSGSCNLGNLNSGCNNSGECNSGNNNSGNKNFGCYNSGDCNYGDYNSGNWNSCNFSSGFFNSATPPLYAFNKPLKISRYKFLSCSGMRILRQNFRNNIWIFDKDMTDEEKKNHPEYETTGGYLKTLDFKTACQIMWENLQDFKRKKICEIPNFDAEIFKEITGIDVTERNDEK